MAVGILFDLCLQGCAWCCLLLGYLVLFCELTGWCCYLLVVVCWFYGQFVLYLVCCLLTDVICVWITSCLLLSFELCWD